MLSIKNPIILMISVSENFVGESEFCFLPNKICPFLRQGICIYVGHSSLRNTIGPILSFCLLALSGKNCVEGRKVKCFNAIARGN